MVSAIHSKQTTLLLMRCIAPEPGCGLDMELDMVQKASKYMYCYKSEGMTRRLIWLKSGAQ